MATLTSWVEHLTTDVDSATEGMQVAGEIYPMVGTEGLLLLIGVIPGYVRAKIRHAAGNLRIPREVELAGLDYNIMEAASTDEKAVSSANR